MITQSNLFSELKDLANNDVHHLVGDGIPSSTTGVGIAGPGSTYLARTSKTVYFNLGTILTPIWINVQGANGLFQQSGRIVSADITSTAIGKFGHALGYPLQDIQTVDLPSLCFPILCLLSYKRVTANYGAGGNTGLIWGDGTAITGTVAKENFVAAGVDKKVSLLPIAGPFVNLQSVNLATTVAFTNPGTAAGYIDWHLVCIAAY